VKSHESTLLQVVVTLITECNLQCSASQSDNKRDCDYLLSRFRNEGLSFLTITLPTFAEGLERSLDQSVVSATEFPCFRKTGAIPSFLKGMLALVFDIDSGELLSEPSILAIRCIRSISLCCKKLRVPCSKERVDKAIRGFLSDEQDLRQYQPVRLSRTIQYVSDVLWSSLESLDFDLLPKHGPGATFERISGNQKFVFKRWAEKVEPFLPLFPNAFPSLEAYESNEYKRLEMVSIEQENPVRVITVPKTLKSPRIIAVEPVCKQYAQQALSRVLIQHLETSRFTSGHVNFRDQSINQKLALISSHDQSLATIDLSAASDRVPLVALRLMFQCAPSFLERIEAFRTRNALLPNGDILPLSKFASMGSALCFPLESMYFYTICVAAQMDADALPLTPKSVAMACRSVYVYGDDIVVPRRTVESTITTLHDNMCKVNSRKSYWTGKFRESCGLDAYDGTRVNPVYLRTLPPNGRRNASELISWCETANLFADSGFYQTAEKLFVVVESIIGKIPYVTRECSILGRKSDLFGNRPSISGWSPRYQSAFVRGWSATPVYEDDVIDGYAALLKCLLLLESRKGCQIVTDSKIQVDADHLRRSALHHAVQLRRRSSLVP